VPSLQEVVEQQEQHQVSHRAKIKKRITRTYKTPNAIIRNDLQAGIQI